MEAWERLSARGSGWFWLVGGLRNGDLYHVCSLARAFRQRHGSALPLYLAVGTARQGDLASLFAEDFDEVLVVDGFPAEPDEWRAFFKESGLPYFGANVPMLLHPQVSLDRERFSLEFMEANGLTWMQLYKQILYLPGNAEPAVPAVRPQLAARAQALCRANGMPPGRSVILFPYAQSLPVKAREHFAKLARDLATDGWHVFTSVAGHEEPIENTRPVFIPFDILIDVAQEAGWIVAVRSGICDISSSAHCRKTYLYPNIAELTGWSVNAMSLTRDAVEQPFDFVARDPAEFSRLVRSQNDYGPIAARPHRLSPAVGEEADTVPVVRRRFGALARHALPAEPVGARAATIITDLPPRDHPRLEEATRQAIMTLPEFGGDTVRCYVCQDEGLYDFFEEVTPETLLTGHYATNRHWHTLVLVRGGPLQALLPAYAADRVLEIERIHPAASITVSDALGGRSNLACLAGLRPLSAAGVQLTRGWSMLETWGVWSDQRLASIRIAFDSPPDAGREVEIGYVAATAPGQPLITFDVLVDGIPVSSHSSVEGEGPRTLRVPLERGQTFVHVDFRFGDLKSPADQGNGGDRRLLGMGLLTVAIVAAPDRPVPRIASRARQVSPA